MNRRGALAIFAGATVFAVALSIPNGVGLGTELVTNSPGLLSGKGNSTSNLAITPTVDGTFTGTGSAGSPWSVADLTHVGFWLGFGDGSDGDITIGGITSATADTFANNFTVSGEFRPSAYRLFVNDTLTLSGLITFNGNKGSNGNNGSSGASGVCANGGAGGAAVAAGTLPGSQVGGHGSANQAISGTINPSVFASGSTAAGTSGAIASVGNPGGDASAGTGLGGGGGGGGGGSNVAGGGTGTTSGVTVHSAADGEANDLITGMTARTLGMASYGGATGGGGGACGGSNTTATICSGGGGGGSGGWIVIIARKLVISGGQIQAKGGDGGNGGNATASQINSGGAAGGGGGGGGVVFVMYGDGPDAATVRASISVAGGSGGTGGSHVGTGGDGARGGNGGSGIVIVIRLGLY